MDTNISIVYAEHASHLLGVINTKWNVYKSGICIGHIRKKRIRAGHLFLHGNEYTFSGLGVYYGGKKLISTKQQFSWRRLSGRSVYQDVANGVDYFQDNNNGLFNCKQRLVRSDGVVVAEFDSPHGLLYEAVVFEELPDYLICLVGWIAAYAE